MSGFIDIDNNNNKIDQIFIFTNTFDLRFQSEVRIMKIHKIITFSVANFTQDKKSKKI